MGYREEEAKGQVFEQQGLSGYETGVYYIHKKSGSFVGKEHVYITNHSPSFRTVIAIQDADQRHASRS